MGMHRRWRDNCGVDANYVFLHPEGGVRRCPYEREGFADENFSLVGRKRL